MFNIQLAEVEQMFSYKQFLKKNVTPVNKYIGNSKAIWADWLIVKISRGHRMEQNDGD